MLDETSHELAQVNVALPMEPLDSARLAEFVANLDPLNALAEQAPGFVWRLKTEDGDATAVRGFGDDRLIINMTVWESVESLAGFVFGPEHAQIMRRRREWFVPMRAAYTVAWWVPTGRRPTVIEAEDRLDALRANGPTPYAFTLRHPFPSPGSVRPEPAADSWFCPA